ncbi:MAG: YARHG domain-containing protein, partial [Lachnospiraceae bacterium]|nr:YARHG domain-containing protein [Lachnospiraceae bacterium]
TNADGSAVAETNADGSAVAETNADGSAVAETNADGTAAGNSTDGTSAGTGDSQTGTGDGTSSSGTTDGGSYDDGGSSDSGSSGGIYIVPDGNNYYTGTGGTSSGGSSDNGSGGGSSSGGSSSGGSSSGSSSGGSQGNGIYDGTFSDSSIYSPDDLVLWHVNSRYIGEEELYNFDLAKLRLIRNELFALHGRIFNSEDLQSYFSQKSWYVPTYEPEVFDENMESYLNDYELANLNVILAYEAALNG